MICHQGACHCGALSYRYETDALLQAWSVHACQCAFCRLHASLTTSDSSGCLTFGTRESEAVQRYRFGAGTADFLICRHCGVYVGAALRSGSGAFGIINVRALCPFPAELPAAVSMSYQGESREARVARRASRWTPLHQSSI